jgi:hypothetical protein
MKLPRKTRKILRRYINHELMLPYPSSWWPPPTPHGEAAGLEEAAQSPGAAVRVSTSTPPSTTSDAPSPRAGTRPARMKISYLLSVLNFFY